MVKALNNSKKNGSGKNPMPKPMICKFCRWYCASQQTCMNGNSEYRAEYRLETDRCDFWIEYEEVKK